MADKVSATVTFPNGKSATVSGKTKEDVEARIEALKRENIGPDYAAQLDDIRDVDNAKIGGDITDLPSVEGFEPQERTSTSDISGDIVQGATDIGKDLLGFGELGLTIASGGASEILSGAANAFRMMLGTSYEDAKTSHDYLTELGTYQPRGKRGQMALEAVAKPLVAMEEAADDLSWRLSDGNPYAATAIKTLMLGGIELTPAGRGVGGRISTKLKVRKQRKEISALAKRLGIDLHVRNLDTGDPGMMAGIVELANKMSPEERAVNMPFLQEAMRAAELEYKNRKNAAYETAKRTRTYVDTRSLDDLSLDVRNDLIKDAYDVADMRDLNKSLNELSAFNERTGGLTPSAINFRELELVRRRTGRRANDAYKSGRNSEGSALTRTKKEIDAFIDNEFNKLAIEQGSAIHGDIAGVAAWKNARGLNKEWRKRFSEDKFIAQLIKEDATPETFRQWLMGASAMGANREAASVISRMKEVLGDNHPAIQGIRHDFVFELVEPILLQDPNFAQFTRNYDKMIRRNPSLVKEIGLREKDLELLYHLARIQRKLPDVMKPFHLTDVTKAVAQLAVGHQIARAALRVNLARGIANYFFGTSKFSKKQILGELAGEIYSNPAIPKNSPLAAEFITGAAMTGITEEDK